MTTQDLPRTGAAAQLPAGPRRPAPGPLPGTGRAGHDHCTNLPQDPKPTGATAHNTPGALRPSQDPTTGANNQTGLPFDATATNAAARPGQEAPLGDSIHTCASVTSANRADQKGDLPHDAAAPNSAARLSRGMYLTQDLANSGGTAHHTSGASQPNRDPNSGAACAHHVAASR